MLDINLFREDKGGNPELIRESQRRRYADVGLVDKVLELDAQWRQARFAMEQAKRDFNALNKEIATLKKAKQDAAEQMEKSKEIKARIAELEARDKEVSAARDAALLPIGNLVHDSVPVDNDEANNAIVREWGEARREEGLRNHYDLVQMLDIVNLEAGTAVAGGRGYYLMREGPLLNQALISFALQFAYRRGFSPVHTPFFMNKDIMAECAQLSQFDEELYKVTGEGEDKYLIATSEQTLCALHRKAWFEKGELPVKYVGYSTCFRKEAGSHGRDTLGIFRIHQFEKVEQFVIASPEGEGSWQLMEEMLANAEEFYQALGVPYRVVNIVSGELNNAAAKKYDLEAWFPSSGTHRELVSCSNCTDFQSRRLDIRMRTPKGPGGEEKKAHVHMLNSTLTATERTLCCILENYQTPDGVRVPPALQPFMMGIDFIPFRKGFDAAGKLVALKAAKEVSVGGASRSGSEAAAMSTN
ncbi:MAG: seryl-tRNA synthetase [Monoraphidium minutum]|nr:MAG: seryl-tRNA synthetase [Monoraphidium minutum]